MTGDELKEAAIKLYGERGWQSALANALGVDRTQVWRYVTTGRVPGPVAAAVNCWLGLTPHHPHKSEPVEKDTQWTYWKD